MIFETKIRFQFLRIASLYKVTEGWNPKHVALSWSTLPLLNPLRKEKPFICRFLQFSFPVFLFQSWCQYWNQQFIFLPTSETG